MTTRGRRVQPIHITIYDGYRIEERTPLALGAAAHTAICENVPLDLSHLKWL